jgi:DNA-binding MarR family transcriptional regulator
MLRANPHIEHPRTYAVAARPFRSFSYRRLLQIHSQLWYHRVSAQITSIQYGVLLTLSQGGLGQRELGRILQLDKSSLAELLRRMELNGMLATSWSEQDRRRKTVEITAAGLEVVRDLVPKAREVDRLLVAGLSEDEAAVLDGLMDKVLSSDVAVAASIG